MGATEKEEARRGRAAGEMAPDVDAMAAPAPAEAPGVSLGAGYGGGMAGGAPSTTAHFGLRDQQAMAAGGKVGTLFQYAINQPVSVPRQQSAMIPIISSRIEGEKLSVYNASADAKYPMNAIQLKNSTALHLMGGAITVFDGGVYAGDALIEDVVPGDERLISYAMDLAVEVDPRGDYTPDRLVAVKIVNGVMTVRQKVRSSVNYVVKNSAEEAKTLLIEHPVDESAELVEPKKADERTRDHYRFRLTLEPGQTRELLVAEETVRSEEVSLADLDADDAIEFLASGGQISDAMKAAVQKLIDMRGELAALVAQREEKDTQIEEIGEEQGRIRENMKELDRQSELYRKYVDKLTAQETELDALREQVKTLRAQEQEKEQAIAKYISELNVE